MSLLLVGLFAWVKYRLSISKPFVGRDVQCCVKGLIEICICDFFQRARGELQLYRQMPPWGVVPSQLARASAVELVLLFFFLYVLVVLDCRQFTSTFKAVQSRGD